MALFSAHWLVVCSLTASAGSGSCRPDDRLASLLASLLGSTLEERNRICLTLERSRAANDHDIPEGHLTPVREFGRVDDVISLRNVQRQHRKARRRSTATSWLSGSAILRVALT